MIPGNRSELVGNRSYAHVLFAFGPPFQILYFLSAAQQLGINVQLPTASSDQMAVLWGSIRGRHTLG